MTPKRGLVSVALALLVSPAIADERADKTVAAFESWMAENEISAGQIAVAFQEEVRATRGLQSDGPVDLASLSKAITGACLRDLVADGTLGWRDQIGDHVPGLPSPFAAIRLGDLMTHSSGLRPDSTQGPMAGWRGTGAPVYAQVVADIAMRDLAAKRYHYNNENYGVLAYVISAATGQPYDQICADRVLAPAGAVSAVPSPVFGRFAAWGGWRMELADYTRFMWYNFGASDPAQLPHADLGGGAQHGAGLVWRQFRDGYNHWNFGSLCFGDGPNFFTFAALLNTGWSVTAYVEGCPQDNWFTTLEQALITPLYE